MSFLDLDFWIGVGVIAGIYGLFALGLQLNVGFTGLINLGQAGFMAIGAYAMGCSSWTPAGRSRSLFRRPSASRSPPEYWLDCRASGCAPDYFGIVTIAFSEIVRYVLQNADFAGGSNQGVIGYDAEWRAFERSVSPHSKPRPRRSTQAPLLLAVWATLVLCPPASSRYRRAHGAGRSRPSARTRTPPRR
jgi:branched-chain amino acid transport system permease protein